MSDNSNCAGHRVLFIEDKRTMLESGRHRSSKSTKFRCRFDTIRLEVKALTKIAFPVLLTNILHYTITLVTSIMTGRLPKREYDALALAISTLENFGTYLIGGLCTVCDTYFSQTIGSGDKRRTGLWLQKSLIIINMMVCVIVAVFLNGEIIFRLFGQEPIISKLAANFTTVMCFGIFLYGNYFILLRYLQNLNIIYPPVVMNLSAVLFNAGTQYVCLYVFKFGFESIAYCHAASYLLLLLEMVAYVVMSKLHQDTWDGFQREALSDWGEFTVVSLSGGIQSMTENICFYLVVIIAGTMNSTLLGAQNILHSIDTIAYMFFYGFGIATGIRSGQAIGNQDSAAAKLSFNVASILIAILATVIGILLMIFSKFILWIFTDHEDIIEEATKPLLYVALMIFFDGVRTSTDGVFRGCGRQTTSAIILFVAYYAIGLPIAVPLMLLTKLQLTGFWVGSVIGISSSVFGSLLVLWYLDWDKEGEKAQKRVLLKKDVPFEETKLLSQSQWKNGHAPPSESASSRNKISDEKFCKLLFHRGLLLFGCLALLCISLYLRLTAFAGMVDSWTAKNETINETVVEPFVGRD